MTGWLILLILAGLCFALLWRFARLDRATAMLVGSALFVAAAGYAWQGSPGLPGTPFAAPEQTGLKQDTAFAIERLRLLDHFGPTAEYLGGADAMNRIGEDRAAVTVLQTGISKRPKDVALRVGLAHALLVQADYNMTPAVKLAFDHAVDMAPTDAAPRYFRGLAALEANDPASAEQQWRTLDASLPAGSPWHAELQKRLGMFDMMRAAAAREQGGDTPAATGMPTP